MVFLLVGCRSERDIGMFASDPLVKVILNLKEDERIVNKRKLQPFAKMLALLDSSLEINKTHQNPILGFGSSLAHLSVARSFIVIGSL